MTEASVSEVDKLLEDNQKLSIAYLGLRFNQVLAEAKQTQAALERSRRAYEQIKSNTDAKIESLQKEITSLREEIRQRGKVDGG